MRPRVYLETSIVSYLTARPSRDMVAAARQALTREWWETEREHFDLFVSEFVLLEAARGDAGAAQQRLDALHGLAEVDLPDEARTFARSVLVETQLPERAALDAFHIAGAVYGGAEYLLTWNFKHLANATLRKRIDALCRRQGYDPPVICTPQELRRP